MFSMIKKGFVFLFILIFCISFIAAANETVQDKATACLQKLVNGKCADLSVEEKIFSLLSINSCRTELIADSFDNLLCWPKSGCKIKTTSQAILALSSVGENTVKSENWLLQQTVSPPDIGWLLQIDTSGESSCTISYQDRAYVLALGEDKKLLDSSAGNCLDSYNDYWLEITPSCLKEEFKISCDKEFKTSLLYKKESSSTFYVSTKTNSASAEGTITEKVNSLCFKEGSSCSYEGSLWATLVLKYKKHDVSSYIPYLVTMMDENSKYLPESFLYSLTNNYRTELLNRQQESKYWASSGDKFYDTAVALFPFQTETVLEKTNAIGWLKETQGTDGCWQSNKRDTAFLLYSIWPGKSISVPNMTDCLDSNNYCMSSAACIDANGNVLTSYSGCPAPNICCDKQKTALTCISQGGTLCESGKTCIGGRKESSIDSTSDRVCCVGVDRLCGTQTKTECETKSTEGKCKSNCSTSEEKLAYACDSSTICCKPRLETKISWLVWLLAVLIVLVILAIIFRNKLKELFFRLKSRFKTGGKPTAPSGRFPPSPMTRPGIIPRRIIPQTQQQTRRLPQPRSDFDEVLRKLKEIGK